VIITSRPKVSFYQTAAPVPVQEILDRSLTNFINFLKTSPLYKVYSSNSFINWNWNIFVCIISNNFCLEALSNKLRKTSLEMIMILFQEKYCTYSPSTKSLKHLTLTNTNERNFEQTKLSYKTAHHCYCWCSCYYYCSNDAGCPYHCYSDRVTK
jgi:hypothetical protein